MDDKQRTLSIFDPIQVILGICLAFTPFDIEGLFGILVRIAFIAFGVCLALEGLRPIILSFNRFLVTLAERYPKR